MTREFIIGTADNGTATLTINHRGELIIEHADCFGLTRVRFNSYQALALSRTITKSIREGKGQKIIKDKPQKKGQRND